MSLDAPNRSAATPPSPRADAMRGAAGRTAPRTTEQIQRDAADPAVSAWVSANAGAGKTHVLALRVLRLLLHGVAPSRILCLTFTRAAAAQMMGRVHARLGAWARMTEDELDAAIAAAGASPDRTTRERARRLFAHALDTPGGLKIQTIHAFCEAVLHRFPLEANVSGRFRMIDDAERERLIAGLRAEALTGRAPGVEAIVRRGQEHALDDLLAAFDARRGDLDRLLDHHGGAEASAEALRARFGLAGDDDEESVLAAGWPAPTLGPDRLREVAATARHHPSTTNDRLVAAIEAMLEEAPRPRFDAFCDLVLTGKGEHRVKKTEKGFKLSASFSGDVQKASPWLLEAMLAAAIHAEGVRERLHALSLCDASGDAIRLAAHMRDAWRRLKHRRGLLDFDDLIARTADLLERDGGHAWVHYKLDRGIDHVLLDEAQDTSPDQWRVVRGLTDEFTAGADDRHRTIFAVGDEKQSIYSFQGAAPHGFATERGEMARRHAGAKLPFRNERLTRSFRSAPAVLDAVDRVFSHVDHRRGLGGDDIEHTAHRGERPGYVEIWPVLRKAEAAERGADWTRAVDAAAPDDPRAVLARRIAATVRGWIDRGETLVDREGTPRALRAGDVMVLVRKRDAFVRLVTRALKEEGVPVAGEDRLALAAHIAAEDLVAIGTVTLNPHDDLALAAALKSPLLGLTEDDLFALAHERDDDVSLYRALRRRRAERPEWREAAERIARWRARVDTVPAFEFYARLLGEEGGRRRILARLGTEASDVLDEFLGRALEEREGALPGLESFLADLRERAPIVKREMDEGGGAVRVMTVHGAKGLEAPVVFLVCPGSRPVSDAHLPALMPVTLTDTGEALPGEAAGANVPEPPEPLAWRAPGLPLPTGLAKARDRLREAGEDEFRRLLYVGMTRAEERLIVCGYRGVRDVETTWHAMCHDALVKAGLCDALPLDGQAPGAGEAAAGEDGAMDDEDAARVSAHRFPRGARVPPAGSSNGPATDAFAPPVPEWLRRRAAREAALPRPLAPSGATALIEGEAPDAPARAGPLLAALGGMARGPGDARDEGDLAAMRRGTVVHRLLQTLPSLPAVERAPAAERYLSRACADLPERWRGDVTTTAMRVLTDPDLAGLFEGGDARTEVPVMGTLEVGGAPRAISGVIDRMVVGAETVLLVDYKTGRNPPARNEAVPLLHVAQMALYRALIEPLFPRRAVRCALVYTEGPIRHDLAPARMDAALATVLAGPSGAKDERGNEEGGERGGEWGDETP